MAHKPVFPSIPVPQNNVDALYHSVMALKQAVEHIDGFDSHVGMARMFVQDTTPEGFRDGDFWLAPTTLSIARAGQWYLMGTLT